MLTLVQHILEEHRQFAHNLFQLSTEFSFAKTVDVMTHFCSLYEGKDQRCSSHEGNTADQTNNVYTCTQLSLATVDKSVQSSDPIDLTLDLDGINPVREAKPWKTAKLTRLKLNPPFKIIKIKESSTSLICLFCYSNPKHRHTQNLTHNDSLWKHYQQMHFQYQIDSFSYSLPNCNKIIHNSDHFANHAVTVHKLDLRVWAVIMEALERTAKPGQLALFTLWVFQL